MQVLDPDRDDSHTLELISSAIDSDNHLFTVEDYQLFLVDSVDSLDRSSLSISLRATDSYGETYDQVLTYTLPTTILSSSVQFPESLSVGQTLSELSLSGEHGSGDVSFHLTSLQAVLFQLFQILLYWPKHLTLGSSLSLCKSFCN